MWDDGNRLRKKRMKKKKNWVKIKKSDAFLFFFFIRSSVLFNVDMKIYE